MGKRLLRALSLVFGSILVASLVCKSIKTLLIVSFYQRKQLMWYKHSSQCQNIIFWIFMIVYIYLVIRYLKVLLLDYILCLTLILNHALQAYTGILNAIEYMGSSIPIALYNNQVSVLAWRPSLFTWAHPLT